MKHLLKIQSELKAPKSQYNSFGNFNYRSCEDILEAVKPLCEKHGCMLTLSDEIKVIGDRYYIEVTAKIVTPDNVYEVKASAREEDTKKGMDAPQITGTASSYARKYALNGLFLIDDTKDADTDEFAKQVHKEKKITKAQVDELTALCDSNHKDVAKVCAYYGVKELKDMTQSNFDSACKLLKK